MSNDSAPPAGHAVPQPVWATPDNSTPQHTERVQTAAPAPPPVVGPFAAPPEAFESRPQPPSRPTNRWAIVGFITSLLGLFPIGLGAGIVALTQLRDRQEQGKGLAIAGIVISGAVVLLAVGAAVASLAMAAFFGPWFSFDEFPAEGPVEDLAAVEIGDCFEDGPGDDAVTVMDCELPHDGELYLRAPLEGSWGEEFPGSDDVNWTADEQCWDAFGDYVGEDFEYSEFGYLIYAPDEESWANGDRTIACTITLWGEPLQGAARGSGR